MELRYNAQKRIVYIEAENKNAILEENFPSKPILSPDNKKAIYISPYEWELIGDIYVVHLDTYEKEKIYESNNKDLTPKDITWINDNEIGIILGYPYGTVATGGDIYRYNIKEKELHLLYEFHDEIQITDIDYENCHLVLEGKKYIDSNYLETQPYLEKIRIEDCSSCIQI